jgi:hypothetical protein
MNQPNLKNITHLERVRMAGAIAERYPKWRIGVDAIIRSGLADSVAEADGLLYDYDELESW